MGRKRSAPDFFKRKLRLSGAYARVREAERKLAETVAAVLPVETDAFYWHSEYPVFVTILEHNGERVKVRGRDSGREYWLYAYRFIE